MYITNSIVCSFIHFYTIGNYFSNVKHSAKVWYKARFLSFNFKLLTILETSECMGEGNVANERFVSCFLSEILLLGRTTAVMVCLNS